MTNEKEIKLLLIELRTIRNILYEHYLTQTKESIIDEDVFQETAEEQIKEELKEK